MSRILQRIILPPGVAKHSTPLLNEGRWVDEDKIRSVAGVPETIGGWDRIDGNPVVTGICRGMAAWKTLDDHRLVGFGTHTKLMVYDQGDLHDITPLRASGTLGTDPFTTTSGSAVVEVAHTAHGLIDGATAIFSGAAAVGGITIDGTYIVTRIDADNYEITHSAAASSSASGGGGSVAYQYEINPGYDTSAFAFGYGVGAYGMGTYGTPRTNTLGVLLDARTWSLDKSGEDLVACPRDGNIFLWDYSAGFTTRAALLSNAPTDNAAIFVTGERAIVALGAGGDPMAVKWCDIDDRTAWTPSAANTAGERVLSGGNRLLAGKKLRGGVNAIWSDTEMFRMTWLGQEPYYGIVQEGSGAGLIGPHAGIEFNGVGYWMGNGRFYGYDGFVTDLPNQEDVLSFLFPEEGEDDGRAVNRNQGVKVYAFRNVKQKEIWWLYQSTGSENDCDRYVMFDIDEGRWHIGSIARTAWIEEPIFPYPIATAADGKVYEHEKGHDAEGAAMRKSLETSPFDLSEGEQSMDIHGLWPDVDQQVGDIEVTIKTRDSSAGAWREEGPYTMGEAAEMVDMRAEGKQCALLFVSNSVGGKFRMGRLRLEIEPGAMRRP